MTRNDKNQDEKKQSSGGKAENSRQNPKGPQDKLDSEQKSKLQMPG